MYLEANDDWKPCKKISVFVLLLTALHILAPAMVPCCACLSGLNVIRLGQKTSGSLSLLHNDSSQKSKAPAGRTRHPGTGKNQSQWWGCRHLRRNTRAPTPIRHSWSLLLSTDQLPRIPGPKTKWVTQPHSMEIKCLKWDTPPNNCFLQEEQHSIATQPHWSGL